jgi:uncharacterized membrane protein
MGIDGDLYNLLLLLHIVTVVVGFGAVALNGVYGALAKRSPGAEGAAIGEANTHVSNAWAEKFIYAVPVFGILLVATSDDAWGFDQTWITLSFVLYIVGIGVAHGVMRPAAKRMNELARDAQPDRAAMDATEKRLAAGGTFLNLLLVVLIALMIWKPGV